jgi:hypothetical protein
MNRKVLLETDIEEFHQASGAMTAATRTIDCPCHQPYHLTQFFMADPAQSQIAMLSPWSASRAALRLQLPSRRMIHLDSCHVCGHVIPGCDYW